MRIAICDDSAIDSNMLLEKCKNIKLSCETDIDVFSDSRILLKSHNKKPYEIILLDVEMPDVDGIELGKRVKQATPETVIIYVSSFPQYAVDSYDCEAFYYLLKPPTEEKLKSVIEKAIKLIKRRKEKIVVYQRSIPISILLSDVFYIEYVKKHIVFHFENDEDNIEIVGNLSDTYELCKDHGFYQIHQGYIVNLSKVSKIKGKNVCLKNGKIVEISIRKKVDTLLAYANFLEAGI